MAISADTGGGGTPFAKLLNLGDELEGALASKPRECVREQREFGKDEVKLRNGKPVKEEILWLVAMPGTTAVTGKDDDHSPIEPLDVVRFAVSGYRWGQVIDARKALPAANGFKAGESASGDVYRIRLVGWSAETETLLFTAARRTISSALSVASLRTRARSPPSCNRSTVTPSLSAHAT